MHALFALSCPPLGGKRKKEGGREERALGGADERNVVMDDDDMRYFLHFYMRHSESLETTCFYFCFCLPFAHLLKIDESFEMKIRNLKMEQ